MSSSYQSRDYQRPEEQQSNANIAELVGTGFLAGAGLAGIAGLRIGRNNISRGIDPKRKEAINKLANQSKRRAANRGVVTTDLSKDKVPPSIRFNKKGDLLRSTVKRKETIEDLIDDELTVQNLTPESRSERARQNAAVRRRLASQADEIIDQLRREGTVDQAATATNSGANQEIGRVKHRLQQNEDVNLARVELSEDFADTAVQQQIQKNNIPLNETPNRDAGINLVSSQLTDGRPVDQAELVATGQGSVQGKQVLENAGLPSGSSSISDLSNTNVAAKSINPQQFVANQLSLFDPRPQSFELQDAASDFNSKVQQLMTSGRGMSRARAEKIILGDDKVTTRQGRELRGQLLQDLEQNTALNPEDASNIAGSVINPITGQREVGLVQKVGTGYAVKGYVRKPFEQRSIPNVDPETNEALIKSPAGKSIKGRAPSYYELPPKQAVRELPGPFKEEVLDRYTADRSGFGAYLKESLEQEGIPPAKMPEGGFAGIGIYGEDLKYVPGPAGTQAGKKPTDLPVSRTTGEEFNPLTQRERSGLKDMSNQGLRNVVSQGTYRSGRLSKPAKAAQTELNIRTNYTKPDFDPKKVSPENVKTSLQASEEMRRARIEGRNPQDALKRFIRNKGLM